MSFSKCYIKLNEFCNSFINASCLGFFFCRHIISFFVILLNHNRLLPTLCTYKKGNVKSYIKILHVQSDIWYSWFICLLRFACLVIYIMLYLHKFTIKKKLHWTRGRVWMLLIIIAKYFLGSGISILYLLVFFLKKICSSTPLYSVKFLVPVHFLFFKIITKKECSTSVNPMNFVWNFVTIICNF